MDVLPGYGRYGIFTLHLGLGKMNDYYPQMVFFFFNGDLPGVKKGNTSP